MPKSDLSLPWPATFLRVSYHRCARRNATDGNHSSKRWKWYPGLLVFFSVTASEIERRSLPRNFFRRIKIMMQKRFFSFVAKSDDKNSLKWKILTAERRNSTFFSNGGVYTFPEEMWRCLGNGAILTSLDNTIPCADTMSSLRSHLRLGVLWNGSSPLDSNPPIFGIAFRIV